MKNKKIKGFTLVELLVVIAILAILATVSVVGYTGFIKKANTSADQQAVTQINVLLEALDTSDEPKDVQALFQYLQEAGLDAEDYKPLVKDTYFYWDRTLNRVLYVDAAGNVMWPEKYTDATSANNWISLSGTVPDGTDGANYLAQAKSLASGTLTTLNLSGTVDCMGAAIDVGSVTNKGNVTISGGTNTASAEGNATLKNAMSLGFYYQAATSTKVGKQYQTGIFFSKIESGSTVTIENLTLEGITTGDYETGSTGLICGLVQGTLKIKNLTIKDCNVYGMNKVGLIAGYVSGGTVEIDNLTIENSHVYSSEGEAALLVGMIDPKGDVTVKNLNYDSDSSVQVIADEYHKIVTVNSSIELTGSNNKTFKPATTQYITKIESYQYVRNNGLVRETKTVNETDCITLAPCPVGTVLAWSYDATDAANYFTADGLPTVDGTPTCIRHVHCYTTYDNSSGELGE